MEMNNCDSNGNTLHDVAKNGTCETAFELIKNGADVNLMDEKGKTPMFYAIRNSVEMVKMLLEDSKVYDWGLFRQALLHGTEEILGLLINKSLLEIQNDSTKDAIEIRNLIFKEFQDTKILITTFLQHRLYKLNVLATYPLLILFAAKSRRKDVLDLILNDYGKKSEIIKEWKIKYNRKLPYEPRRPEELNVQGYYGETALHYAVAQQLLLAVEFLLQEGADPNCQDKYKFTPLHLAALFEDKEMCLLLLSFNAVASPSLGYPENPLELVCGYSAARDPDGLHPNYYHDEIGNFKKYSVFNLDVMRVLLKCGADTQSPSGMAAMFEACKYGFLEELNLLLEYGAKLKALDRDGNSALHYATSGSIEVVDFLLKKGFDVNLKNFKSYTPLMFAVETYDNSHSEIIEYLVYRGAKINAMNAFGETALHIAVCRNSSAVECLLEMGADWSILNINENLNREIYCFKSKQKVLISFVALKEKVLDNRIKFYVGNKDWILEDAFDHFEKSKLEITTLQTETISKYSKMTYFDFLMKDFYTCVQVVKNSDWRTHFNPVSFPCYGSLLKFRFEMAEKLADFVDEIFCFLLKYTKLPIEIVEMIMVNFRMIDFRVFGRVLSQE